MSEAADAAGAGALSQTAQKKLAKMEAAAQKKAAKAASAPVAASADAAAKPKDEDEEELDPTQYFANRVSALEEFKKGGGVPYPHKFKVDLSVPEFVHRFSGLADGERRDSSVVSIAGRIWSKRWSGQKLVFYDLRGGGSKVQVMADAACDSTGKFQEIHNLLRRGDIVGVIGYPGTSCPSSLHFCNNLFRLLQTRRAFHFPS
jgi:lysyl-tRNA synthetase class 2